MRRLFVLLLALGLVGGMGCRHVAGICDCQYYGYTGLCCYGGYAGCAPGCGGGGPVVNPVPPNWGSIAPAGEPLKQMPQPGVPNRQLPAPATTVPME